MSDTAQLFRVNVAWCRKGRACGNPYLKGEVHFPAGTNPPCPRCGGDLTNTRRFS